MTHGNLRYPWALCLICSPSFAAARSTISCSHRSTASSSAAIPTLIDLTSSLSRRLTLKRPIVSANMDTVTRSEMAIAVAEEGGIGIIDRGFRSGEIEPQVREVQIVKRKQHGIIRDPYTIAEGATLQDALTRMRTHGGRHARG